MNRIIFIVISAFFSTGLFSTENMAQSTSDFGIEEVRADSIFNVYSDAEFKKAVFQVIQKNSLTNPKLFLKTLNEVKLGKVEKKERDYGFDNISKEYSEGLNGWTITLSGMLVVFVGLILILIVIHGFNFLFKIVDKDKPVKKIQTAVIDTPAIKAEDIPEDHLIAVATAVELYKRLYLINSMTSLTFIHNQNSVWKSVSKYGLR